MLAQGEVNPLNVFGLRLVEHCPPHFERVLFDLRCEPKDISDWIYSHLEGRFYMGTVYTVDTGKTGVDMQHCVAFERHAEASYFALMLDQININNFNF
jgi:hypothetical protein